MGTEVKQSAIKEVRDQMSLDRADGKHLNIVGSNLGLSRPRASFNDDEWRAVVKAIALDHKQIKTKFEEMLAIFFGPRITVNSGLTVDTIVGQKSVFVADHEDWPQVGIVIFDEGLATEETLNYCLIDRATNELFLTSVLAFAHTATVDDTEQSLIAVDGVSDRILVADIAPFPDPASVGNYTIVVGTGTAAEEIAEVTAVDFTNRVITLAGPLANTHTPVGISTFRTTLARDYNPVHPTTGVIQEQGVALLTVTDAHGWPSEGDVLLSPAGPTARNNTIPLNDSFVSSDTGSTSTIVVAASTFEVGGHSGSRIVFDSDTTTVALCNVEAVIVTNTATLITVGSILPDTPVSGDTFRIRPLVHYTDIDYITNTLTLNKHIPDVTIEEEGVLVADTVAAAPPSTTSVIQLTTGGLTVNAHRGRRVFVGTVLTEIVSNTVGTITVLPVLPSVPVNPTVVNILFDTNVELLEPITKWNTTGESVDVSQVKSLGTGWDVFQTAPNCVEILTPANVKDVSDVRSASYLHTVEISPTPTTTLVGASTAGDSLVVISDPTGFPVVGVVELDGGTERIPYHTLETFLTADADSGDTSIVVPNSANFPTTGDIVVDFGGSNEETVTISANNPETNTLTISALASDHLEFTKVRDKRLIIPNVTLGNSYSGGEGVVLYQPVRPGTSLLDGNLWFLEDVFPGPYIYQPGELTWGGFNLKVNRTPPNMGVAQTQNTKLLPGPTQVSIDQIAGKTALEVEDATAFELETFPYKLQAGLGTGNQEKPDVEDVNLRQRTATFATGATVAGVTSLVVDALDGGTVADKFPNSNGYRVMIARGLAQEEVAYVTSTSGADTLNFEQGLANAHSPGHIVELLADVLSTTILVDSHDGIVDYNNRSTVTALTAVEASYPQISSTDITQSEIVAPEVTEITINTPTNFPDSGGKVYLNFSKTAGGANDVIPFTVETITDASVPSLNTFIPVVSLADFPDPADVSVATPFVVVLDPGGLKEEILRVVNIDVPNSELDLDNPDNLLRFAHPAGTLVRHVTSKEELLTYTSVVGNTLRFSPPIVLQFTHSPGESAIVSLSNNVPSLDGYDFPFYLPPDLSFRLQSLLDLVRAAGVEVKFIDKR